MGMLFYALGSLLAYLPAIVVLFVDRTLGLILGAIIYGSAFFYLVFVR